MFDEAYLLVCSIPNSWDRVISNWGKNVIGSRDTQCFIKFSLNSGMSKFLG